MDKTPSLKLGTYNLRNVTDYYHLRLPLLKNAVNEMNCDIMGLQEVSFLNYNQLDDIFPTDKYSQYNAPTQLKYGIVNKIEDKAFNIDGNSLVISKGVQLEEIKFHTLHLSPVRNCCMLSMVYNGIKISVVNTHLHHVPSHELIRLDQTKQMLRWIEMNTQQEDLIIIVGDFNTLPFSATYNHVIDNGYVSAYYTHNSCEPLKTFHNKIEAPHKDTDDDGTFDYILYKYPFLIYLKISFKQQIPSESSPKKIKIEQIKIYGQEECKINKGIFASDHYGMMVELNFEN